MRSPSRRTAAARSRAFERRLGFVRSDRSCRTFRIPETLREWRGLKDAPRSGPSCGFAHQDENTDVSAYRESGRKTSCVPSGWLSKDRRGAGPPPHATLQRRLARLYAQIRFGALRLTGNLVWFFSKLQGLTFH